MATILGVIPARLAATRLPGKPLELIAGRTLVQWVFDGAVASEVFDRVVVATCDQPIADVARAFGANVVMTSAEHETGTDRVAEVAAKLPDMDIVANVQGDQPFVDAPMLEALVMPWRTGEDPDMTTLGAPLVPGGMEDPNTVKVVCDQLGNALYFSRSAIPHLRNPEAVPVHHHLGLYAYTSEFLQRFASLPSTPLERAEGLEQLRALEHGHRIRVCPTAHAVPEVNTREDLEEVRSLARSASPRPA